MPNLNPKPILCFIILAILMSSCATRPAANESKTVEAPLKYSNHTLPITARSFFLGLVPNPKSIPETTWNDIVDSYIETGQIAEVVMVWSDPAGIGQYEKLKQTQTINATRVYGLKPVVTLNFATIKEVQSSGLKYVIDAPAEVNASLAERGFRDLWISEARNIARDFKPEYFSLGNEINDYFYIHPDDLKDYLSLVDEASAAIKEVSPKTKVLVVLSYNHLIDNNQWDLFDKLNSRVDMIGLTSYPWKKFNSPADIPPDYYTRLKNYTQKPIAFTEIGWISAEERGSSEDEQAKFLVRFLELTKGINMEMVNWLFLHETKAGGVVGKISEPETNTIALKRADGTKKEVYNVWLDLKNTVKSR